MRWRPMSYTNRSANTLPARFPGTDREIPVLLENRLPYSTNQRRQNQPQARPSDCSVCAPLFSVGCPLLPAVRHSLRPANPGSKNSPKNQKKASVYCWLLTLSEIPRTNSTRNCGIGLATIMIPTLSPSMTSTGCSRPCVVAGPTLHAVGHRHGKQIPCTYLPEVICVPSLFKRRIL